MGQERALVQLARGSVSGSIAGVTAEAAEVNVLDDATAGTVVASKATVVDSNKDISAFRNVGLVNLDAGASGTAGSVDVFPTTASKGKLAITKSDNTNNDTTTINVAAQAAAQTLTVPDPGTDASFVMTAGTQTIGGVKTLSSAPVMSAGESIGGAPGAADSFTRKVIPSKACTDNTATAFVTFTIPNANHSAVGRILIMAQTGGTDAFESTRVVEYAFTIARTSGANAVAVVATAVSAQIATVASGDTLIAAAAFGTVVGAVGASNTISIEVTLNSGGNQACVAKAVVELLNSEATGITFAAA